MHVQKQHFLNKKSKNINAYYTFLWNRWCMPSTAAENHVCSLQSLQRYCSQNSTRRCIFFLLTLLMHLNGKHWQVYWSSQLIYQYYFSHILTSTTVFMQSEILYMQFITDLQCEWFSDINQRSVPCFSVFACLIYVSYNFLLLACRFENV